MGGLSIWHWVIVLIVVLLVFGTKKLRNAGGDLGAAIKNFMCDPSPARAVRCVAANVGHLPR